MSPILNHKTPARLKKAQSVTHLITDLTAVPIPTTCCSGKKHSQLLISSQISLQYQYQPPAAVEKKHSQLLISSQISLQYQYQPPAAVEKKHSQLLISSQISLQYQYQPPATVEKKHSQLLISSQISLQCQYQPPATVEKKAQSVTPLITDLTTTPPPSLITITLFTTTIKLCFTNVLKLEFR